MSDAACPRKPDTRTAMAELIAEVRATMPFGAPEAVICSDHCAGCSKKLLEFLDTRVDDWEHRLADGDTPTFGDLHGLARSSRKIHKVLKRNGLVE